MKIDPNLGMVYLAEQTSPDQIIVKNMDVVDKNGEKSDFCKVKNAVLTEDQHISEILLPDGIWLFDKPNRNYADVTSIINNLGSELYVSLLNCHI